MKQRHQLLLSEIVFGLFVVPSAFSAITGTQVRRDTCDSTTQCLNGGACQQYEYTPAADVSINSNAIQQSQEAPVLYNHCNCPPGYNGFRCEDHCPLVCLNGGICQHSGDINNPLQFVYDSTKYYCRCKGYFTGNNCGTPYQNCPNGTRCFNGGTCHQYTAAESSSSAGPCDCKPGFGGPSCQLNVSILNDIQEVRRQNGLRKGLPITLCLVVVMALVGWIVHRRRNRRHKLAAKSFDDAVELPPHGEEIKLFDAEFGWRNVI